MKNIFLPLIVFSFFLLSCESKFLDVLPKELVIAQTTADFRKLLDNADTRYTYNLSQVSGYVDVVSDDSQLDSVWFDWERDRLHAKQLYAFEPEVWLPDGAADDNVWKQNYYVNSVVSTILDGIVIAKDDPKQQKQLIAEAKVHRSYAYLTLVNIYAKHYNKTTANTDLGVPLFTNPVDLPKLNRASVAKVYQFIISELMAALPDLPDNVQMQNSHRPTKVSVYAILARAYLYMGEYEKAIEYADLSLAIKNFLYDYNTIFTGLPAVGSLKGLSRTNDEEMLLHKTTVKSARISDYAMLDSNSFNDLYSGFYRISDTEVENTDLRRVLWFEGLNSSGKFNRDRVTYTFAKNRYKLDNAIVDYIPVSTPEVYLTRAECRARLNNLKEALDDVNAIRQKRYKSGKYTAVSPADFGNDRERVLQEVLLERRRELYGRDLRLFDVKRLGLPVSHILGEEIVSASSNDQKLIWPIYYNYIVLNPEIDQNQR
ncbi:RagB/SusD family nutrient uptake outer membrane protein [Sphingobacterium faecale]|uniref:RagB/SusD family nutrient uptake outer membrane protein n=1 Tax=Sphingobacterium faecale TaxID=2803775 RepID=A0ABS1R6D2_9SPHI|nr:RagB/SusD family nutrient uptake outer membrane protein [Sphingobacterium faecale]MBL1409794.1 RagB/SusD family nutrient uptake outer membrane protein [Sphingobacterium faecale]